jgi:transcriptional regulator with XRE-family HTH domain
MSEREAFGPNLRRVRIKRGISLEHISEATKVSAALWAGLECNDFSRWPSGIYARAYVRAYALEIGADPEAAVNDFCRSFSQGDRRASRVVKAQAAIVGLDLQWKDDPAPGLHDRRAQPPEPVKDGPAAAFTRLGRLTAAAADIVAILMVSTLLKAVLPIGWLTAIAGIAAVYHTVSIVSIGSSPAVWALVTYLESRHPETRPVKNAPRLVRLSEQRHGRT